MGNNSKLTEIQIDEIREKFLNLTSSINLAKEYSVSRGTINNHTKDLMDIVKKKRIASFSEIKERVCDCCLISKLKEEFYSNSRFRIGIGNICKDCSREKDKIKSKTRPKRILSPEREELRRKKAKERYHSDLEWKEKQLETNKIRRRVKPENRKRKKEDPIIRKIKHKLRNRLLKELKIKNLTRCASTMDLLGCSINFFKDYIASQFREGMSWENHGRGPDKWHLDHIRPCCSFDFSKEEDQRECFHYTNIQPLWETENLSKNGRY